MTDAVVANIVIWFFFLVTWFSLTYLAFNDEDKSSDTTNR